MMQSIVGGITGVFMTLAALLGISAPQSTHVALNTPAAVETPATSEPTFGAFAPAGGLTYYLQSSIGLTNTTITLSSFQNRTGIPLTMALLNTDVAYATLDPQTTISEFISFTGITQNANGTATLTGVTRGLSDIYPFTASSTMRQPHSGQSRFILSDPPQLFNEYAAKRNNENISGVWNFTSLPTTSVACTGSTQFCNKAYIDAGLNQGAATSTETNLGIVELTNLSEIGTSIASSSAGGPLVIPNKFATTTPSVVCNTLNCIVAANAGKLSTQWIDPASHYIFGSTFAGNASTTNATTTALAISGSAFHANGVNYRWPSTVAASSTSPMMDGNGNINFFNPPYSTLYSNSVTFTSTTTVTIPANTLGPTKKLKIEYAIDAGASDRCNIRVGNNSSTTTLASLSNTQNDGEFMVVPTGASTERYYGKNYTGNNSFTYTPPSNTMSFSTASPIYVEFATSGCSYYNAMVTLITTL